MENQAKLTGTSKVTTISSDKEALIKKIKESTLSTSEKEIALASCEKKVKEYNLKDITVLISSLIYKTHAECGTMADNNNINITIDSFIKDVRNYNTNISFQEIELSFRNGYKGEYGEWFGLNNKTYFQWINGYTQSVKRRETIKKRQELLNPPPRVLSDQEKKKIIHEGCLKVFEEFKLKGSVMDMGNVNYNYLDSLGIFQWAKGRKFDFIRQAQDILKGENQSAWEACKDIIERQAIRNAMADINNAQSTQVISMAKRIGLNEYFKCLVEVGEELKDKIQ